MLESGMATDLQDAYDKAVWQRTDIRQAILAQQQKEAEEKRQKEATARAAKAVKGNVTNLRTQGPAPTHVSQKPKSWEDSRRCLRAGKSTVTFRGRPGYGFSQ